MEDPKPGGFVSYPGLVLFGFVAICIAASLLSDRRMCPHMPSDRTQAVTDLVQIHCALYEYAEDHGGAYPASFEALLAPDAEGHSYLVSETHILRDPWNREFIYVHGSPPNVLTYGRDGVPGGTGDDADIDYESIVRGD